MFTSNQLLRITLPYSIVSFARDSVNYFVLSFYFLYLSKVLGLPLNLIVPMLLLVKVADLIKEPFIGMLMDVFASRFPVNKFRFFIIIGGLLNGLALTLMFNVPHVFSVAFEILYSVLCYVFWSVSFSVLELSSWSLLAIFGTGNKIREFVSSVARLSTLAGFTVTLIIFSKIFAPNNFLPKIAQTIPEKNFNVSSLVVGFIVALAAVLFGLCFRQDKIKKERIYFKKTLRAFLGNDQMLITFAICILQQISLSVFVCSYNYFILIQKAIADDRYIFNTIHIPWMITATVSLLLFRPLVTLTSRKTVFIFSTVLPFLGFSMMFVLNLAGLLYIPVLGILISVCVCGFALSLCSTTVMTADCADYSEFKFGFRSECLSFSIQTLSAKFGFIFIIIITGLSFSFADIFVKNETMTNQMYSIYLCIMIVAICGISMLLVYIPYYKLHGSFFENILNALTNFAHNNRLQIKEKFNSVRYALDEHCVINRLRSDNLDEIIRVLTDRLYDVRAISSKADFINGIREKMSINPAGIAHGIAIPHTRGAYVRRSALAVATLRTPIKCGASDNKPCDLFFLIATPDDGSSHINLLSNLSLLLSEPGFANKLRNSGSSEEITKRLISCEKNLFR